LDFIEGVPRLAILMTPDLCRASRALVKWRQADLAKQSGVPEPTIQAFENGDPGRRMATMNNKAILAAFEAAGLQFIPENGGGLGVRYAKPGER
jgi:DNA-binding XRE family transcriptional regulator